MHLSPLQGQLERRLGIEGKHAMLKSPPCRGRDVVTLAEKLKDGIVKFLFPALIKSSCMSIL